MKTSRFFISLMSLLLVPAAFAAGPVEKRQDTYYSRLWTNSPFTTKPPPDVITTVDPFADYALSAVSPVDGGYMVILQNKKKPDERIKIVPGQPSDFKVVEVKPGNDGARSTTVTLNSGSKTGTVAFDDKLLVIKNIAPKGQQGGPGAPGAPNAPGAPGNPNNNNPNGAMPMQGAPVVNNGGGAPTGAPTGNPGAPGGYNGAGGGGVYQPGAAAAGTSSAGNVRPPRPRVIPSQGQGGRH